MKKRHGLLIVAVAILLLLIVFAAGVSAGPSKATQPLAKNVIIMIADGTGFNQYIAGEYYQYGDRLAPYESFPFRKAVSTYPLGSSYDPTAAWLNFTWVEGNVDGVPFTGVNNGRTYTNYPKYLTDPTAFITESDMAATAMATGYKTKQGVGWVYDGSNGFSVKSILEYAEDQHKATGVVTTKFFDDATPAGFAAHLQNRDERVTLAQQMVDSKIDVVMGAGNPGYNDNGSARATASYSYISSANWAALNAGTAGNIDANGDGAADPWALIQDRSAFQALATGDTPSRVFGIVKSGKTMQEKRPGDLLADPFVIPFNENLPTLVEMTNSALNVLDNDSDGFVAMIEGGDIDDAWHEGYRGRAIEAEVGFNNAVQAVCDWVEANSNWGETLLIVTADHDTGYIWGPGAGTGTPAVAGDPSVWVPVVNNGADQMPGLDEYAALNGAKAAPYPLWHVNALVPLFAKGAAARLINSYDTGTDPVRGKYIDNTDIFKVMYRALGYSN